ncbi:RES family NAD+ phosphorylase [Achromobacter sp. AGC25]
MIALWRLSNSQDLQPRARPPGRWHGAGAPVVVLDANPAAAVFARLALSEVAHPQALPSHYFLLEVMAPDHAVSDATVPLHWETDLPATRAVGDAWLARGDTLLLRVPSAAGGVQYLLNAAHSHLARCQIVSSVAYPYAPHLAGIADAVLEGAGWLVAGGGGGARD